MSNDFEGVFESLENGSEDDFGFEGVDTEQMDNADGAESWYDETGFDPSFVSNNSEVIESAPEKKAFKKRILIGLGTAFVIIVAGVGGCQAWNRYRSPSSETTTQAVSKTEPQKEPENNRDINNNNENLSTGIGVKGWESIQRTDIAFSGEKLPSSFVVISVNHYAKVASNNNDLMVFTILTGSLSGFDGSYDLVVPYSKGQHLSRGDSFTVEVEIGEYNEKLVVGEISF